MHWAESLNKYPWVYYLAGGLLLGVFIGYQVLPSLIPRQANSTDALQQPNLAIQEQLEARLAASVKAIDGVTDAQVQLATPLSGGRRYHRKASVTLSLSDPELSTQQMATIADLVASGVDHLEAGGVMLIDASGHTLNSEAVQQFEKQRFWTDIAINVAKILGIVAALITIRFIIQAIHKGVLGEDPSC